MLLEEIKNIKSEKRDLRNFGLVIGIALAILGLMLWWKGKSSYSYFLIFSVMFIFCGLLLPSILRPLQKAWMIFAVILGWIMTRVILSILFYLVFTGIGLGMRLFGKQFLDLRMEDQRNSYWTQRVRKPFDRKNYERQF